jgi:hypothetical protein
METMICMRACEAVDACTYNYEVGFFHGDTGSCQACGKVEWRKWCQKELQLLAVFRVSLWISEGVGYYNGLSGDKMLC